MPCAAANPDINAFLDAYAALGVEHSANPADVRQAYKQSVRRHHPDRHAAGSPAQREATERMTVINAAYQLVRDAPLRHHRVSTRSQPDVPWNDAELDQALSRARTERVCSNVLTVAGLLIFAFFMPWLFGNVFRALGVPPQFTYLVIGPVCLLGVLAIASGNGGIFLWRAIRIADVLIHFNWR